MRTKLRANGKEQQLVLDYLEQNASEVLVGKINAGTKTMDDCWKFIIEEARKIAKRNCACVEDATVYGWAVHFFEEDEIKPKKEFVNTGETVKTKHGEKSVRVEAKPKPIEAKPKKEEPKELAGQISIFDL